MNVILCKKNNNVPYRALREALRIDNRKISAFNKLATNNNNYVIYECMHSSSIKTLRTTIKTKNKIISEMGLYSYYTKIIQNHNKPDLLTTGYVFDKNRNDNNNPFITINEDMQYRALFSTIDPRLVHIPEQNFLVKAAKIKDIHYVMHYSFLEANDKFDNEITFSTSNNYESAVLLLHMYKKLDTPKIIFDFNNPITLELSNKMFQYKVNNNKIKKMRLINKNQYEYYDLSQHCFNIHNTASI